MIETEETVEGDDAVEFVIVIHSELDIASLMTIFMFLDDVGHLTNDPDADLVRGVCGCASTVADD